METYDILIVGGATTGSYFARKLAERGRRVLVIDHKAEAEIGSKYDIFHIAKSDFERFALPEPQAGEDLAFEFSRSRAFSAFGHYPKASSCPVVGMHLHDYTLRLNRWAREAGAEFRYGTSFVDFAYEEGRVVGARIAEGGHEREVRAALVADASGMASVARTRLPEGYGVENFAIGPEDMFYVVLRYARYLDEKDYVQGSRSWTYYKTWEAPQAERRGAILGVGANLGFDRAEEAFARFEEAIELPRREITRVERGTTPYRRPPYSFVADGFIALGDAACLTKPHSGEGVTSSMVQADLAVEVADGLLGSGKPCTRANLWPVNKRYYSGQGKAYAAMLATLAGAVATDARENEFFFERDVIFSAKSFEAMAADRGLEYSGGELVAMALKMAGGVLSRRLRLSTVGKLLRAMGDGGKVAELYADYPAEVEGFPSWERRAEATWARIPRMADALR